MFDIIINADSEQNHKDKAKAAGCHSGANFHSEQQNHAKDNQRGCHVDAI